MTLDRDIRFTTAQIYVTTKAVRKRRHALQRSIAKAEANRRSGLKIQHGTHEANIEELAQLDLVYDALEAARQEIGRKIAAAVNHEGSRA